ncbi:MAG: hypothetical protein B6D36_03095 [Planctomycetes bacterium UTPLA1]|jgi:hypothetical protein|nr:MAG: hypothetical protein B6D36_03095 [Planctomycetes bacterium UTPLA1]
MRRFPVCDTENHRGFSLAGQCVLRPWLLTGQYEARAGVGEQRRDVVADEVGVHRVGMAAVVAILGEFGPPVDVGDLAVEAAGVVAGVGGLVDAIETKLALSIGKNTLRPTIDVYQ